MEIKLDDRYSGCLDLKKAGDWGMKKAYAILSEFEEG
jgi:hypothetical protein